MEQQVLVIGGPGSGKSTWIGCLYEQFALGNGLLERESLPLDGRGMDTLVGEVRRGRYPERTLVAGDHERRDFTVHLATKPALDGVSFELHTADHAGEELEGIFRDRQWRVRWRERSGAAAVLLFIAVPAAVPLPRLRRREEGQANGLTSPGLLMGDFGAPTPEVRPLSPDDAVRVPTVVALVEMVQFLRDAAGWDIGERPPRGRQRVGVVFTQWDAVGPDWQEAGPQRLLEQEYSLLHDLLWSGYAPEDVRAFGLSSTSGDLNRPADKRKYMDNPGGYCVFHDATQPGSPAVRVDDLGLPVTWGLFGERGLQRA